MSRIRMIFASVGITFLFALSVARAQSMKLLTPEVGWALMGPGLIWTADAGQHWSKITPPLSPGEYIASVFFLDTSTGWALLSKPPSQGEEQPHFQLAATSDSGANWSVTPMSIPSPNRGITLAGSGVLDFVDPLHGWVNLDVVSSSNFRSAILIQTNDGGGTWTRPPGSPGVGGELRFITTRDGWLAGGPGGERLYVTHNGSLSWERVSLTPPREVGAAIYPVFPDVPVFEGSERGFLPVIFSGRAGVMSALVLFTTDNGGRTWRADRVLPALGEVRAFPTTVADETLIAGRITDRSLTLIRDARGGTVRATAKIAPERSAVTALSFVDSTDGWALVQYNGTMTSLLSTSDGGNTWTDVTPRPEHKPYPAAARTRSVQSDTLTETLIGPSTLQTVTPTAAPATGGGFSFWSGLPALSVAAALSLPLPLAALGLAVASPSLPRPPPARLLAARLAAIARQRLLGPEDPLAALQQTNPTTGTTSPLLAFPPSGSSSALLIFGRG